MAKNVEEDEILYECECFRVVRFTDEEGGQSISISLFDHGLDLYLSDEEFGHLVEALTSLQHVAPAKAYHH